MIVGIDASNIRSGGTINHLAELLRNADPSVHDFSQVIVWGGSITLGRIEPQRWLIKRHYPVLDGSLLRRSAWQRFQLSGLARAANCDVLFVPGGSFAGNFFPVLAMSQNLLPFEWRELRRFGWSWLTVRLVLLRITNTQTFRRVNGCIFLTKYAHDTVMRAVKKTRAKTTVIPFGIDCRFTCAPRKQFSIRQYTARRPYRILYVSTIDMYKHHCELVAAVGQLRGEGFAITLDLIGSAYPPALKRLQPVLDRVNSAQGDCVRYVGAVPYDGLATRYAHADLGVFASSCESMPNILLESMAAGLPIACSRYGPMPEILGQGGVYFDPESVSDIARALRELLLSSELRARVSSIAFERARTYSWRTCAEKTFRVLKEIAQCNQSQHLPNVI